MKKNRILIKYGGNAMRNAGITREMMEQVYKLYLENNQVILVHGGGPFIEENLKRAGVTSEFIGGHRKTTPEAMKYIEMALKGDVNSRLVGLFNQLGGKAVGISGKDGRLAVAEKRMVYGENNEQIDLGHVGDVTTVNPELLYVLLDNGFLPVIASVATSIDGKDYNVNADMFAGVLAGKLAVDQFVLLTDVDGLRRNPKKPETLMPRLHAADISGLTGNVIQGGMIPKTEACRTALELGAGMAVITNGTQPDYLLKALQEDDFENATKIIL